MVDRIEGNDETIGEEFLDLDFVTVEIPAFGFFEAGVQPVDHPAEEFVAGPSDDESVSDGLVDCFVRWVG